MRTLIAFYLTLAHILNFLATVKLYCALSGDPYSFVESMLSSLKADELTTSVTNLYTKVPALYATASTRIQTLNLSTLHRTDPTTTLLLAVFGVGLFFVLYVVITRCYLCSRDSCAMNPEVQDEDVTPNTPLLVFLYNAPLALAYLLGYQSTKTTVTLFAIELGINFCKGIVDAAFETSAQDALDLSAMAALLPLIQGRY